MLLADGFEKAFIGVSLTQPSREEVAVYDFDTCIKVLMSRDDMDEEQAVDYFYFNVVGAWVGDYTPLFIQQQTIELTIEQQEELEDGENSWNKLYNTKERV